MRTRIVDKRVLTLVKTFLKAGILGEDGRLRETDTGTPQGGILSPLLSNIALSVLDEHLAQAWQALEPTRVREKRRRKGLANCRIVRYADDFVVLVAGSRAHAEALRVEVAAVLAQIGLRLSESKTRICHIDEGFDFLGFRIQRHRKRGASKSCIYTYPSKKALAAVKTKVRGMTQGSTHQSLVTLLQRLNPVLRGWTNYFRHGASSKTFSYLSHFAWRRVLCWLCHKARRSNWAELRRRFLRKWWPTQDEVMLFNPAEVPVIRYRYRGATIPSPWVSEARRGAV